MIILSVVVGDFDIVGVPALPSEADSPLIVDPDTVLARAVSREALQSIPWGYAQVAQRLGGIQQQQLPMSPSLDIRGQPSGARSPEHLLRCRIRKASNHQSYVNAFR